MCNWVCYLLSSLDSHATYIGSSNNEERRLNQHNNNNPNIKRRGARRTRGQSWMPILIVSGFHDKRACLSFEAGWKRLCKRRNNERFYLLNCMVGTNIRYIKECRYDRILDLLYFMHNFTLLGTKFMLNTNIRHPMNEPDNLVINIFIEEWIADLPWPYFVKFKSIAF